MYGDVVMRRSCEWLWQVSEANRQSLWLMLGPDLANRWRRYFRLGEHFCLFLRGCLNENAAERRIFRLVENCH
jgi:hypothetical protein